VYEAFDWDHGTFLGSVVGSEVTAAAIGLKAGVRRDPFAMLPFAGYNMADYFNHWINIGKNAPDKKALPKIYCVNWFRKDEDGKWLWPGFGDNIRVLKWIFGRCAGTESAVKTPIGYLPEAKGIDLSGLDKNNINLPLLLSVDKNSWMDEIDLIKEHYAQFGDRLPKELKSQLAELEKRFQ
jgi:phosphoenolpyruvate carboxykinase (GTP)